VITSSTGAVRSEQSSHSKLESDITIKGIFGYPFLF